MFAIYDGMIYIVGDDLNDCLLLDADTRAEVQRVSFGSPTLVIDPTDDQLEAARPGRLLPSENDGGARG